MAKRSRNDRSKAAQKGFQTSLIPERMYQSMIRSAAKYRESTERADYSRFRAWKRRAYKVLGKDAAFVFTQRAVKDAGWEESVAVKFAKFS